MPQAAPHKTLVLLLDGGSTPQSINAVYSHGEAEVGPWLPALQPQFLHHCTDHVTAALHTIDTLQQRREGRADWSKNCIISNNTVIAYYADKTRGKKAPNIEQILVFLKQFYFISGPTHTSRPSKCGSVGVLTTMNNRN